MFELPLHVIGKYNQEEIKNSFTAYRSTGAAKDLWSSLVKTKVGEPQNYLAIYSFYKELMEPPALAAWSFFALFLLVLPTGNALAERGFSAMGAAHSKNRSELSVKATHRRRKKDYELSVKATHSKNRSETAQDTR